MQVYRWAIETESSTNYQQQNMNYQQTFQVTKNIKHLL